MIKLDTTYIFQKAGGVRGLINELDAHCPGHNLPYPTVQMWRQRNSIPSQWVGAVLYVMLKRSVPIAELFTDEDELCAS